MTKKIISLFVMLCMLITSALSAFAYNPSQVNSIINKLLSYSKEDRENIITILRPLITTDSGIGVLIGAVEDYQENKSGMLDSVLKDVLDHVDKDTLARYLKTINCVDAKTRRKYYEAVQNKQEMSLSQEAKASMELLLADTYALHPNLKKLFEQDKITTGVIANFLRILYEINGSVPILTISNGNFAINQISDSFSSGLDAVWRGYVGEDGKTFQTKTALTDWVNEMNSVFTTQQKQNLATAFQTIGILKSDSEALEGFVSVGSGIAYQNGDKSVTVNYEKIDSLEGLGSALLGNGVIVKLSVTDKNGVSTDYKFDKNILCKLGATGQNIMMYRFLDGSLIPVKNALSGEDGFYALISGAGYYVLKSMPKQFADANGWGSGYIEALYQRGIINGKSSTAFMPDANITREEFVKLVVELFDLKDTTAQSDYQDLDKNAWYYGYVASAQNANIIQGVGDNRFGVGENIKRQDMAKIISNILASEGIRMEASAEGVLKDYSSISDYAKVHVLSIYKLGIISGDENGYFNPHSLATRQEAAKMIYGMLKAYIESVGADA